MHPEGLPAIAYKEISALEKALSSLHIEDKRELSSADVQWGLGGAVTEGDICRNYTCVLWFVLVKDFYFLFPGTKMICN